MFKQMAATAGGVAVGSAVGHMAGAAMMGGSGGGSNQYEEPAPQQSSYGQMNGADQQIYGAQPNQ